MHIYTNLMQQSIFNFGIQHLWRDIILMKFISIATVPPTSYVLQLGTLAGGTTDYYASHIQTCFNVIVSSYAEYHKLDPIQTKSTIIHHLKNTLTNRVAVNHCVVQSLRSSLDIELLKLKCNVHPLDGIAKRCTDLLRYMIRSIILLVIHLEMVVVQLMLCMLWQRCALNKVKVTQEDLINIWGKKISSLESLCAI